jgi:Tfp pilus assembly protein PilE
MRQTLLVVIMLFIAYYAFSQEVAELRASNVIEAMQYIAMDLERNEISEDARVSDDEPVIDTIMQNCADKYSDTWRPLYLYTYVTRPRWRFTTYYTYVYIDEAKNVYIWVYKR